MAAAESEIQEVPLEPVAEAQISEENTTEIEEPTENEPPPIKKRGRPPGAKNKPKQEPKPQPKAKPKPKAKRAVQPYAQEESESSEEEPQQVLQRPRAQRRAAAPPELDRTQLAAEVLGLLQQQHVAKASARRRTYASWFNNM